jgi:hypothetical protein
MSAKSRLSRDQRRRAKLAARAKKRPTIEELAYRGEKYRGEGWTAVVFQTEVGIYEAYMILERRLTNKNVERALIDLIGRLRGGVAAPLSEGEKEIRLDEPSPEDFLIWNIRRNWTIYFEKSGPVATHDLVGILRTLLYSITAHAWHSGPTRGYLHFLEGFMEEAGVRVQRLGSSASDNTWSQAEN